MNILYYLVDFDNLMTKWQHVHIFDELERHGHYVHIYDPQKYRSIEDANENIVSFISNCKTKFDLFMNCMSSEYLFPGTIINVNNLGLPTLLICFDNLHAPFMHKNIAHLFDIVWLTSFETKLMFEKWGCKKILFQPYAANPYTFTPRWCDPIHSVCFIGSPYGSRVNKLNLLTKSKIDCDVYSDTLITPKSSQKQDAEKSSNIKFSDFINQIACALSFKIGHKLIYSAFKNKYLFKNNSELDMNDFLNAYSSVTFEDMQVIYSNSLLSLNITELRNTYILKNPIHKIHLRTFEIPMCGGLEIASYTDELAGYFEDGKEIVLYKTDEEFISKTKFYLDPSNSTQVFKMKKKARLRAENDHTWMKRFQNIFDNL